MKIGDLFERMDELDRKMDPLKHHRELLKQVAFPAGDLARINASFETLRPTLAEFASLGSRITESLRPTALAAEALAESGRRLVQAYTPTLNALSRSFADIGKVAGPMILELHNQLNQAWAPALIKLSRVLENAAAAARRVDFAFTWAEPTPLEFLEEAYGWAAAGSLQDKQDLMEFTREYLRMPTSAWWQVGSALLRTNWRNSKDPIAYLRAMVRRDAIELDRLRMGSRLEYSANDLSEPTMPWEEFESRLSLEQAWNRANQDPEVRALVAARLVTDSYEAARVLLGWELTHFRRVHQRLHRLRARLRQRLFDA